jgi:ferritin-like metal-binding protein YciE
MNMTSRQLTSAFEKYIAENHKHLVMFNQYLMAGNDKDGRMQLKLCTGTKDQIDELFTIFKKFMGEMPAPNVDENVKATM